MGSLKLVLVLLAVAAATVKGRPQEFTSDPLGLSGPLNQVSETGSSLLEAARSTGQTLSDEVGRMFSDFWTSSAQGLLDINTAFRETAVGAIQGVRDVVDATNDFVGNSARAGGRLASDYVTSTLNVSRDAAGATGQFVSGVSRSALQGFANTADAAANFVDDSVGSAATYNSAANGVARSIAVSAIDNFTNQ